jgi:hypothetical protein
MAGVAEMADILLRSGDPDLLISAKRSQPVSLEKFSQVTGDIDAIHFVGKGTPIPLLLQFANCHSTSIRLRWGTTLLPRANKESCWTFSTNTWERIATLA